jgi:serine/threonine protein kinase
MGVKLGELEVLDLVATGGMAEVYRARLGGKMLAIKRILPQFTKEKDLVQMFVDEAKVASTLRHPAVVRVFDLALTEGGDFYILMEFADGRDLSDVLYAAGLKNTRFTPAVATYAARQVLSALHYAHNAVGKDGRPMGLIHRDISPHNVMAGYDGWVKLTDFGIAKVQHSGHQTMAGVVKGKFGYMSPEQARGKKLDGRSDLYNVGILLYEMVSGERLFAGSSDISTLDRMRAAEVPPLPRALGCPPELEAVIRRALQKSADDRFPDAAGFDAALADVEARCGLRNGAQELSKLVNQLYGSSRVPAPERPSKPPVAIRSATAQRPEESELLNPSAPPPAGAGAQRAASVARMAAAPAAPSAVRSSLPAMADPNAPPRTVSGSRLPPVSVGGGIRTTLPQIPAARVPSQTRLPPVPAAPVLPPMATDAPGADEDFSEENTRLSRRRWWPPRPRW